MTESIGRIQKVDHSPSDGVAGLIEDLRSGKVYPFTSTNRETMPDQLQRFSLPSDDSPIAKFVLDEATTQPDPVPDPGDWGVIPG